MLTLEYIPFTEIEHLTSNRRVTKLLSSVKKNKVILMQGRLRPEEEAALIQKTMEEVSREFKGIELCTVFPDKGNKKNNTISKQLKQVMVKLFMAEREGMTIIGPANVIKEIKRNPDKIELLTHNLRKKKKKNGKK